MSTNELPSQGLPDLQDDEAHARTSRAFFSSLSIRHRLPLMMAVLLSGIIVASTWASYRGVKESALEVGRERLTHLTEQLTGLLQQSSATLIGKTYTAANDPAIHAYLSSPSDTTRPVAVTALQQFTAPQDPNSLQVEVWNADRSFVLASPAGSAPEPAELVTEFKQSAVAPFKVVGSIRVVKDEVIYPIVAGIKDDTGKLVGYLVRWRKLSDKPESRKQLTELLGSQATLYFGNSQGDLWTDMGKVVSKPPGGLSSTLTLTQYRRDGNSVMALGRPINGTPWFIVVEISEQAVLSQTGRFLRRVMVVDLILLLIGLAGAFALSRSITRPLHSLTRAASAISGGDYTRLVDVNSRDELGELAGTFNTMVVRVGEAQRDLEQKVRERTAQLEAANKELEAFSYSVSHDLRAPLRGIDGFSKALLEDYGDKLDEKGNEFLNRVRTAAQRMAELIDNLLGLSQVTRGELIRKQVDLSALARSVAAELKQGEPGRVVEFDVTNDVLVEGDPKLLLIVIENLFGNAWKFTSKHSHARVKFGVSNENGETIYYVRDDGAGFEMAYAGKLFGAFQRLHQPIEFQGTGIGLATVGRIIRRHGGRVWAEGEVEKGATFSFTLTNHREGMHAKNRDSVN
jgi:signal transduction histidine kinase